MNQQHVEMKVVTWARESHGLFDYESKNINVKKFKVDNPCKIYRSSESEVELLDYHSKDVINNENSSYLTSIISPEQIKKNKFTKELSKQQYYLSPSELPTQDSNYLIVRSLKNKQGQQKGYSLIAGDILKLGRIEYLVLEIKNDTSLETLEDIHQSELHNVFKVTHDDISDEQKQCKICLGESCTDEDFFLSPCKCKGSCQYVHFQCLRLWVDSKVSIKQVGTTQSYNWNKSVCEICKTPLPKKVQLNDTEFNILEIQKPEGPYLILESLAQDKKVSKNLFIIQGNAEEMISMGRGHNCEVRIADISVSRTHSFIKYINNQFVITDNNSKFGSLIKLINPFALSNDKVAVQVGRTVITFVIKSEQNSNNKENNTYYTIK